MEQRPPAGTKGRPGKQEHKKKIGQEAPCKHHVERYERIGKKHQRSEKENDNTRPIGP